ncbi:MAG: M48 family metallopeptidase [Desulfobacteraceae bacterium]|nr:M48 family metallopeptidase [Desulfobacteraceae bacterium]
MNQEEKIRNLKSNPMYWGGYSLEIVRKKIKHIYFRVYPSKQKVVVSAPIQVDVKTLDKMIASKKDWILKQIKKGMLKKPDRIQTYTTDDKLLFKGKEYFLQLYYKNTRSKVCISSDNRIHLYIRPHSDINTREKVISTWYRRELKKSITEYIAKWQPIMGVKVNEFGVRKMKTRWGSCNINAKRIWLNFTLIKFAEPYLEYVIVHEMVHLLERKHNNRFKSFMDQFIPDWRNLKQKLDQ